MSLLAWMVMGSLGNGEEQVMRDSLVIASAGVTVVRGSNVSLHSYSVSPLSSLALQDTLQSWVTGEEKDLVALGSSGKGYSLLPSKMWLFMVMVAASMVDTTLRSLSDIYMHMFLSLHKQDPRGCCQGLSFPQITWKKGNFLLYDWF